MISNSKANSAVSMNSNMKEVYEKNTLKPDYKTRRKFSKIRKILKDKQKN